jgi:dTDP-4-dehydrorhamnose 3,5-epimerase
MRTPRDKTTSIFLPSSQQDRGARHRHIRSKPNANLRWPFATRSGRTAKFGPVATARGCFMLVEDTAIPAVKIITPKKHGDARGFFSEVYNRGDWDEAGLQLAFVQDNHSFSAVVGTLRGLHFQTPPFAQDKLVRCTRGRILDVAVDIRRSSPTFGRHVAVELSAENWRQLLVPIGFAHAFVTLEPDVEVLYKTTAPYSAANDRGVAWDDPDIAIAWPSLPRGPVLSDKDRRLPRLKDAPELFK